MPSSQYTSYLKGGTGAFNARPPRWRSSSINVPIGTKDRTYPTTQCTITFEMPEELKPPVYLFYRLTNFYQNHRRYVQSYSQDQLAGKHGKKKPNLKNCQPLDGIHFGEKNKQFKAYYPCGLIANSQFNDTIGSPVLLNVPAGDEDSATYEMTQAGTAWSSDRDLYVTANQTHYTNDQVIPPPNWMVRYPDNYTDEFPQPDLKDDEAFQNWMRTAGLPTFSKLYRRNDNDPMRVGRYQINITDSSLILCTIVLAHSAETFQTFPPRCMAAPSH